ncbi:MAG: KH domain-containing protein [Firmicutes bacterium]|nr:KH domain-containing protein [Bacillota bacterium]NLO65390.1 KH domain-containing protein [Bacillota bacterium]
MQALIEFIGKSLAENPDQVRVEAEDKGYETVYTLYVAPDDMGRLIGKGGRIAKAIRTVVKASAIKSGVQVHVKIDEAD